MQLMGAFLFCGVRQAERASVDGLVCVLTLPPAVVLDQPLTKCVIREAQEDQAA